MGRFVIEHLPRSHARYEVSPLSYAEALDWIQSGSSYSLVRTTELIEAMEKGAGIALTQADALMEIGAGDEALLVSLSYSVLLACAEGDIAPLPEDWRFFLLRVEKAGETQRSKAEAAVFDAGSAA